MNGLPTADFGHISRAPPVGFTMSQSYGRHRGRRERDEELASIEAFLAEVEWGPTALLLAGEAGIGKTVLWAAGVEEAGQRSITVLTCRGVEAEASLSFAGLSELLAPVVDEALSGAGAAPPAGARGGAAARRTGATWLRMRT